MSFVRPKMIYSTLKVKVSYSEVLLIVRVRLLWSLYMSMQPLESRSNKIYLYISMYSKGQGFMILYSEVLLIVGVKKQNLCKVSYSEVFIQS